ncbi:hypothetical protein Lsai_1403 [Legionella sainthelensi]|uniref:Uncharacterized protein n=1 Tax=Legionella sainthelensi TaxID=28087 RepID=A0A0W0YPF5_9GAMM|nr:hypothetical protein [Legionella sainthelensi]KTD58796.1 hypothetical protein Lsai_1403 [Legionella sainthelensi]VEH34146.1 Uncharacterised protein [Legionella sainthelensi]
MLDLISNGFALRKKSSAIDPQETRNKSATDRSSPVMDSAISAESAKVMNQYDVDDYIQNDNDKDCMVREYSWYDKDSVADSADIAETQAAKQIDAANSLRNECGFTLETLMGPHVVEIVQKICQEFSISASYVLEHLLSKEDINDIADGNIPIETLKLHIELWMANGMPHYSGRPE